MPPPSSSSFTQELFLSYNNQRLLLHRPPTESAATPQSSATPERYTASFNTNVIMVLSVLLCALFCSLGFNSIIRCALKCSRFVAQNSTTHENDPNNNNGGTSNNSAKLANTGVRKKALKTFPTVSYSADLNLPGLDTECVICLSEFAPGERVRLLPRCNHGFHVRCIDMWLTSHSSCPTCRDCLVETCQKIVGCSNQLVASSSEPPIPLPSVLVLTHEISVNVEPLEREDMIHSTRSPSS